MKYFMIFLIFILPAITHSSSRNNNDAELADQIGVNGAQTPIHNLTVKKLTTIAEPRQDESVTCYGSNYVGNTGGNHCSQRWRKYLHATNNPSESRISMHPKLPSIDVIAGQMTPGRWYYVETHNKLRDVFAPEHEDWSIMGPGSVLGAWSGGAVNNKELLIWGGGHADYGGNEVYLLNLDKLLWQRATEPSRYRKNSDGECIRGDGSFAPICETLDGAPASVHSYDAIQFLPRLNKFWLGPGSAYRSGNFINDGYLFDTQTLQWTKQISLPIRGYLSSAVEPKTGYLLIANGVRMLMYDPSSQQVLGRTRDGADYGGASPAALDTDRMFFVQLVKNGLIRYDLSVIDWQSFGSLQEQLLAVRQEPIKLSVVKNGKTELYRRGQQQISYESDSFKQYGIDYDPDNEVFVLWDGHPNILLIDPVNWRLTELVSKQRGPVPSVTSKNKTHRKDQGVFGRWRYHPKWQTFVGYNDKNEGLWLYKVPPPGDILH